MNCNCKIIRDLLPLYHDEVASEESRELVEEHLKTCAECGKILEDIHEDLGSKNAEGMEQPMVNGFKALKKTLRRKTVSKIAIVVICAVAVVSALTYGVFFYETPVSYSEVKQTITKPINSALDAIMSIGDHNSVSFFQKGDEIYVCASDTFWTRHIAKPNTSITLEIPDVPDFPVVPGAFNDTDISTIPEPPAAPDLLTLLDEATKKATNVYFIEGIPNKLGRDNAAFDKAVANAILIWEK